MGAKMSRAWLFFPVVLLLLAPWPAGGQSRPPVGVAFGGGSARGIAHVGVIRWLEEHHIPIMLDRGSLALSMRASMSFPGIFPPVQLDGRVLVDGGAMNNLPADVVRDMGAAHVIAVNVSDLADRQTVNYSVFGLMGAALDAMVRANSRTTMAAADLIINVPLDGFSSLDFSRSDALIEEGYRAPRPCAGSCCPWR